MSQSAAHSTTPAIGKRCRPCSPKPALRERPLLTLRQARELEDLFTVLASDTRLRLLHAIAKHDEICVTDLAASVDMKQQAVSNQLQRLSDFGAIEPRRSGNNIYYRVVDPCVLTLLDRGMCMTEDAKRASS